MTQVIQLAEQAKQRAVKVIRSALESGMSLDAVAKLVGHGRNGRELLIAAGVSRVTAARLIR